MQQVDRARRDPAPSRLSYRMHRLWLTPLFRLVTLFGLPLGLIAGSAYVLATRTPIVENAQAYFADLRRTIEERPEFMVKLMAIDGAADEVADDVREILPIDFPVSSFDLDLGEIRARVEELDAVASASVRIRSGGILQVDIVERTPSLVWRGPQGIELLDSLGHRVASLDQRSDRPDLPLIAGEGADQAVPEALALIAESGPLLARMRGLVRVGERRWDIVLDRNQRILLPEHGAEMALERVVALEIAYRLFARDVTAVDYRNPDRPTIRTNLRTVELQVTDDPTRRSASR